MMKTFYTAIAAASLFAFCASAAEAAPCTFDTAKECTLFRDVLNDISPTGLRYYAATNYDHRISGEINVFDAALVQPYCDTTTIKGSLRLIANRMSPTLFKSGEIMTRPDLDKPPYNAPARITPFTTKDIGHGYVEARVKLPKCDTSDDGLCQNNTAPTSYNRGLWPSVWLLPVMDTNWPQNGEIDIFEAYQSNRDFNVSTATLHFNGNDARCGNNDCKGVGYALAAPAASSPLYNDFHTWGFEWQPDPNSAGGFIMTGYFDNVKIWGPLTTASLPADGPNAMSRGFSDPAGGFYLITALAIGGPYAGAPNAHLVSASMYIQSIKAFTVSDSAPPPNRCPAPINIRSLVSVDKKQVTFSWQEPGTTETILNYQINDTQGNMKWKGTSRSQRCYTDQTLPGTPGTFSYLFYTNCSSGQSASVKVDLTV